MRNLDGDLVNALGPAQADPADPESRGGLLDRLLDIVCKLMDEKGRDGLPLSVAASTSALPVLRVLLRIPAAKAHPLPPPVRPAAGVPLGCKPGIAGVHCSAGWQTAALGLSHAYVAGNR